MSVLAYNPSFDSPPGVLILSPDLGANGCRFSGNGHISPRQVDSFEAILLPVPPGDGDLISSEAFALRLESGSMRVLPGVAMPSVKVVIGTGDGSSHEAVVNLDPGLPIELPLGGLIPERLVVQSSKGVEICRWPTAPEQARLCPPAHALDPASPYSTAKFDVSVRHLVHLFRGLELVRERQFADAIDQFEQALLYNAEDHLVWWVKAVVQRIYDPEFSGPELPNAHFLAPLEPVLRAEAFFSSSDVGDDAGAIIQPLADSPEDLVEIACQLLEHGLPDLAHRWIEEALRHRNVAILRYLLADALHQSTRMDLDAAVHVSAAAQAEPFPYPWREVEISALQRLATRYPENEHLRNLLTQALS
jgi:hypothetical protein